MQVHIIRSSKISFAKNIFKNLLAASCDTNHKAINFLRFFQLQNNSLPTSQLFGPLYNVHTYSLFPTLFIHRHTRASALYPISHRFFQAPPMPTFYVFEISNVHNERNINLKFVILVRIRLNGFSGDCKSKMCENKVFIIFKCN